MIQFSMLSLVTRAAKAVFDDSSDNALWTISIDGVVAGSLVREGDDCRLSWFAGADPRLVAYAGPLDIRMADVDIGALANRFAARLGARSARDARISIASAL